MSIKTPFPLFLIGILGAAIPADEAGVTTLSNRNVAYTVPDEPYAVLRRGEIEAIIVDNRAVDDTVLSGHRAGYSGVASLTREERKENLFVPSYAGLNFEHIHDGTTHAEAEIRFEPRHAPMELRRIDEHTAELYQAATPFYALESCTRYRLLADGPLEMTFECVARRPTFENGYIGLFWASYIHQPASLDIHFMGHAEGSDRKPRWVRGVTPAHGQLSTHRASDDDREFAHDADFPMTLVFNMSRQRYDEPWYYGLSRGMAYAQIFRPRDGIRFSQSPSGGGGGNPAWDFQWFIPEYELNTLYRMVMRAAYVPFQSPEQVRDVARREGRFDAGPR